MKLGENDLRGKDLRPGRPAGGADADPVRVSSLFSVPLAFRTVFTSRRLHTAGSCITRASHTGVSSPILRITTDESGRVDAAGLTKHPES